VSDRTVYFGAGFRLIVFSFTSSYLNQDYELKVFIKIECNFTLQEHLNAGQMEGMPLEQVQRIQPRQECQADLQRTTEPLLYHTRH
jgi:hypothetical protein